MLQTFREKMRKHDKKGGVDESWNPGCAIDGVAVEIKEMVANLDLAIKSALMMPSLIGPLTNRCKVYVHSSVVKGRHQV